MEGVVRGKCINPFRPTHHKLDNCINQYTNGTLITQIMGVHLAYHSLISSRNKLIWSRYIASLHILVYIFSKLLITSINEQWVKLLVLNSHVDIWQCCLVVSYFAKEKIRWNIFLYFVRQNETVHIDHTCLWEGALSEITFPETVFVNLIDVTKIIAK